MAVWVVEFSKRGYKIRKIFAQEWKLLNFKNWVTGEMSKVPKFDFQKLSKSFSIFFH